MQKLVKPLRTCSSAFSLKFILLFLVLFQLQILGCNTNSVAAAKSELGWSLNQNRKNLGIYKVCMASSGMCIEMPNQSILVFCFNPGKTVFVVNKATKRICQVPMAVFEGQMLRHLAVGKGMVVTDVPIVKTGQIMQKDIKVDCYGIDSKRHKNYLAHTAASVYEPRQIAQTIHLSALAERSFPAAGRLMTKLYGLPALDTMPIEMDYHDPQGGGHLVLDTRLILRKNVDSKLILPTGLKKSSLDDVLLDGNESSVDILNF